MLESKRRDGAGAGEPSVDAANPDTANAPDAKDGHTARFGFTITKKQGNAVHRNRIRRRLKAAVTALYAQAMPGCDYVVVARNAAFDRDYPLILSDLQTALTRVNRELGNPGGPRPPSHRGGGRGRGGARSEAKGGD